MAHQSDFVTWDKNFDNRNAEDLQELGNTYNHIEASEQEAAEFKCGDVREFQKAHKDVAELKTGVTEFKNSVGREFEAVHKDIAKLETDVAQIKTNVAELKTDVAQLKTNVAELKTDVAEIKTNHAKHNVIGREFEALYEDIAELKADVAQLKTDIAELTTDIVELKTGLAEFKHSFGREFEEVHKDIAELKNNVAQVTVDFKRFEGVSYNRAVQNPTFRLTPIVIYQPGEGIVMPNFFPKIARDFYNLRTPTAYTMEDLIYLVRFYDVQGYQNWEAKGTSWEVEPGEQRPSQKSISVEDAVQKHPHLAVEALESIFGLVEENFSAFYERADMYQQRPRRPIVKRQQKPSKKEESGQKRIRANRPSLTSKEPSVRTAIGRANRPPPKRKQPSLRYPHWLCEGSTDEGSSEEVSTPSSI